MENNNTIVAIATPYGAGGVGIVRISGERSLVIAKQMFKVPENFEPRHLYLGKIDAENFSDRGFFVYFKGPLSYTGEDVVEFQAHGGTLILQKIVEKAVSLGAVIAERGEFTRRAFMNNKISLNEAEGLMDLINASSEACVRASERVLSGEWTKKITVLQSALSNLIAEIGVFLDYPEIDDEEKKVEQIRVRIKSIQREVTSLKNTYKQGQQIKNGVNVCIVGRPNVGKSSLLNAMLGKEMAIVTEIAGTTTDVICDSYSYKTMRFNIIDTAGIRDGQNQIEKIGIEKSKKNMKEADIVLFVLDLSQEMDEMDKQIKELVADKKCIYVLNKVDKKIERASYDYIYNGETFIEISAQANINIDTLKDLIYNWTIKNDFNDDALVVINERHFIELFGAEQCLLNAFDNIDSATMDCTSVELQSAWYHLGTIIGNIDVENIIDNIFANFCVGK